MKNDKRSSPKVPSLMKVENVQANYWGMIHIFALHLIIKKLVPHLVESVGRKKITVSVARKVRN